MIIPTVYLAGPITGISYSDAVNWRRYATAKLMDRGFQVLDPMDGKDDLAGEVYIKPSYPNHDCETVFKSDVRRVRMADYLLVNLSIPTPRLIGTIAEMAIAWERGGPPVITVAKDPSLLTHPFIVGLSDQIHNDLDEAIDAIDRLYNL